MVFDDSVFEILLQSGINAGFALRLSMTNKSFYNCLMKHSYYWKYVSLQKLKWTSFKLNDDVIKSIKNTKKCRECGTSKCYPAITTSKYSIFLCVSCTNEEKGFSELYSRQTIFSGVNVWSHKRKFLNVLTVAKKGTSNKFLYWAFEVKKYRIQRKVLYKRTLPAFDKYF